MELASIVHQYYHAFMARFGNTALPGHLKALDAILNCRTPESGELYVQCPDCEHAEWRPLSCGNRHCPRCQNHLTSLWIDKQQEKLLPVPYFMATFTLPSELRQWAWFHQKTAYSLLFKSVAGTLKDFGLNPKNLGAEIGITSVLHTNTRSLDYHPHIHAVVPGGGIDRRRRCWKKVKTKFLFNEFALANVFRARFLEAVRAAKLTLPQNLPKKWVVHCNSVGKGFTALKYLSRYLYRGVISEKNIVSNHLGKITFRYVESKSGITKFRSLKGEEFLRLILLHVLPKGFRRVRDYGLLHCNAKKLRSLVQLILHATTILLRLRPKPAFVCPCCRASMVIVRFRRNLRCPG
jgi:hypothetical protein